MEDLVTFVQRGLKRRGNARKAREMAAYMKTEMPFYGVQKPDRVKVYKGLKDFPLPTRAAYERAVKALWKLPHREEKYTALHLATIYPDYVVPASMPLYETLIRQGQWWDFVDVIASQLVGMVLLRNRAKIRPKMNKWIDDDDMWIRRTAIISQIKHKADTDHVRLFRYCKKRAHEKEFFIRKGIGWALREYSYAEPARVIKFLRENRETLSPLSFREGAKALKKRGQFP